MSAKKKVFVGLSGGVDSAVSAALLQKDGYDVTGVFIKIAIAGYPCPAAEDRREALRVAAYLQIPFREIDLSREYEQQVLAYTLASYARGETPNPDTLCNKEIKFGLLYDYAMKEGADYIATGHYARTKSDMIYHTTPSERSYETHLLAGADPEKDQSYFLWMVPEERLRKTLFPVGALHKTQVRKLAQKFGLPNAARKDSQGLCFLGALSLDELLINKFHPKEGSVLDLEGQVIGKHRGTLLYTIGQRHGFEIFAKTANEEPHYVIAKDLEKNTLTVSVKPSSETDMIYHTSKTISLREENWIGKAESGEYEVRFRYRQKMMPALVDSNKKTVTLKEPAFVPTGQSLVVYKKERCLGGGNIEAVY